MATMPQMHLPFFPDGVEHITVELAFERKDGQVTYFNGHMPVFIHAEEDTATFGMITAQFCIKGNAKQDRGPIPVLGGLGKVGPGTGA
jgi:hypothetical protein